MIDEETLLAGSGYNEPYQKEKDYLEELFLAEIYLKFSDQLVFKGGTAISKFYGSPRFSDDLDFSASHGKGGPKEISVLMDDVISKVNKSYSARVLRELAGGTIIKYELSIRGPLFETLKGHHQHLKIEINWDHMAVEQPNVINREPRYQDIQTYVAVVMAETEILAEKAVTLLFRPTPKARDLYDLYYMAEKGTVVEASLVDRKMHEYKHSFDEKQLERRLSLIEKVWDKELRRLLPGEDFVAYRVARDFVMASFKEAELI